MAVAATRRVRESHVEKYLVKRVREIGGDVRKVQWIGRRHAPDRVVLLKWSEAGKNTIWVELKAPGEKPRPGQLREHKRMRDLGQDVRVLDSFEAVDRFIAEV